MDTEGIEALKLFLGTLLFSFNQLLSFFETEPHVAQTDLELAM